MVSWRMGFSVEMHAMLASAGVRIDAKSRAD